MLRSTGFFRGIDCPFYKEYTDAKGDKNGCNRPYCHFRHSKQRRASYGTTLDIRKQRELDSKQKEQAYDPFNPEVVPYQEQKDGEPSGSGDITGALELVNKAIEEVQSEVEREKRKLSRIGDEEYDPISNLSLSTVDAIKRPSPAAFSSHLAYDPGSYQMTSSEYNPTPCCSKYTLDSDIQGSTVNSMEYVPTLMRKPAPRTHKTQHPSPPPTPIYSNNSSSSKFKYILDNSKPSTDMEYDPLSNYSAKITGKHKKEEGVKATHVEANKVSKQAKTGRSSADEEYVPTAKKSEQSKETQKYTFSDTEEESSGTEYRPTSLNRLQKKANSVLVEDAIGTLRKYGIKRPASSLTQRSREELKEGGATVGISDVLERRKSNAENETLAAKLKNSKSDKVPKVEKEAIKVAGSKVSSSNNRSKEKGSAKKSTCDSSKKDGQSQRKKDVKSKEKESGNKLPKGLKEEKKNDGKSKLVERLKSESGKRDKSRENGAGENKKLKMSDKEKEHGKHKDHQHKNGKHEGSKRENDISKNSKHSSNSSSKGSGNSSNTISKSSSVSNKVSMKRKRAPLEGNRVKDKRRTPSLSHADLFGDESPEEAEAMAEDDEEDMEEVLVRKSANALKRRHVKKQVPQPTPSSSEGEDNFGMEDDAAARDEIDYCGVDLSILQDDMDFDSDPMEECLRIFNESKDVKKEDKGRQAKQPSRDSEEDEGTESTLTTLFPGQKKRVSHFAVKGNTDAHPKTVVRPYRRQSAQEICYQRLQIAQQQAAQLAAAVKTATASPGPNFPGERRRIAHRPNPAVPSSTKPACSAESRVLSPNRTPAAHVSIRAQTSAGILSKTSSTVVQKRLAHTPTMKSTSMKRPVIPMEFGAKVPTNIRQRYLTTFIDECVKFCPSEDVAFQMALDEEKVVYERSSSKNIYLNVAVNTLKKLRSKSCPSVAAVPRAAGSVPNRRAQSHEEVLGGRLAATTSFTINRMGKQQEEKPIGATLYRKLRAYLMTEEQLQEHGYPRAVPESSGRAVIYNLPEKKAPADPFTKICCRCGAEYKINVNGNCVRKEECNNHWGRLRRHKVSGGWETNYNCCSGAVGSLGCQVCKQHVQDGRKESLDGYVKTFSKALPPDGNGGVYALDCEMCYTKLGLELTRVTVINAELKVIYDTFVKPDSKVVDYNTRFSGVTEDDLDSTTITLRDVQAVLLNMFSAESILIGHSLESDLLALKLIHSTVIDTAIVFPHRLGLPYKRALRNLMADHLKRIIQDNVEGHDSSEDASACMELIIWKLKEDAKVKR